MHYDQVGSLRAVSDSSGNIIKEIEYDSFGNVLLDSNPDFKVPFGFAGGLHDSDTGLVHFGYREYDPCTGKWTAKDPILFAGGDSNLYGYVLNDPVNLVDPSGLESIGNKLKKGFDNPAICTAFAAASTTKSIDKCRDLVWDAYYDKAKGSDDYDKMCPMKSASPVPCVLGCVSTDFYNNLKKYCLPDTDDPTSLKEKDKKGKNK